MPTVFPGECLVFGFLKPNYLSPRLQRLKTQQLFSTLTARELTIVEGLLHMRKFLAGEIIFDEGEDGQALYILFSGTVSISRNYPSGREILAELTSGSFFGDLALLDNTPRTAQIRAKDNCEMAVFFRADFMGLLETDATIGYKISLQLARNLAQRLRAQFIDKSRIETL